MYLTSDVIEEVLDKVLIAYEQEMGRPAMFLLLDDDSYMSLRESVLGREAGIQNLIMYKGMRVLHNDFGQNYIATL
jgi:hypothetical protein